MAILKKRHFKLIQIRAKCASYPVYQLAPVSPTSSPKLRRGNTAAALNDLKNKDELVNISSKKKLVAWFVSHCVTSNRREDYVRELSKHIPVDIYGKCGNLTCSNRNHCKEMVRRDYKFCIAFKNSLCTDYVTEKLAIGLIYDAVPVSQ
jgi:alpha-1,3-fucosyltransferase